MNILLYIGVAKLFNFNKFTRIIFKYTFLFELSYPENKHQSLPYFIKSVHEMWASFISVNFNFHSI